MLGDVGGCWGWVSSGDGRTLKGSVGVRGVGGCRRGGRVAYPSTLLAGLILTESVLYKVSHNTNLFFFFFADQITSGVFWFTPELV